MGRKISLGAALTVTVIAVTLVFSVTMVFSIRNFNNKVSSIIEREGMYEKFTEIDTYVRQNYSGDIDETALMDAVAQGYLSGIDDRYADYLSAEEYAEYLKSETGAVSGVGVSVTMESSGYMQVTQVYEGSAASGAGIQTGDLIIKIDEIDITADTFGAASELLTGDAGTKVTMTIRRDDEDTEMEITRRTLTINTVFITTFGDFTYIRVSDFAESTPDQVRQSGRERGGRRRGGADFRRPLRQHRPCLLRGDDARPPAPRRGPALRDLLFRRDGGALRLEREADRAADGRARQRADRRRR